MNSPIEQRINQIKEIVKQVHRDRPEYRNSITAEKPLHNVNVDIMIMDKLRKKPGNKNFAYAFVVIDIYSRGF